MVNARAHINPGILIWARKRFSATPEQIPGGDSLDLVQRWEGCEKRFSIE